MSCTSRLDPESEKQLLTLFDQNVNFRLLYKSRHHGVNMSRLFGVSCEQGSFILLLYLGSGDIRGGYLKKSLPQGHEQVIDRDAFLFTLCGTKATRFSVKAGSQAFQKTYGTISFGNCLQMKESHYSYYADFTSSNDYEFTGWSEKEVLCEEVELYRVQAGDLLLDPWRTLTWTEIKRDELKKNLVWYKPAAEELSQVRVLLLGPVGAGKSSFINSIKSVLYNRVMNLPIIGTEPDGFTKKLKSYSLRAEKGGQPVALTLCDVLGLGNNEDTGLSLHDALAVIKGHVPEGYKFHTKVPIKSSSAGYCLDPELKDKIHCVVFVLDACRLHSYGKSLIGMLKKLHRDISDLDVPQLVLLTHVDEVCHAVNLDVRYIYSSRIVQSKMEVAASLVDMPVFSVLPVKNYVSELTVNRDSDTLLLSAVHQILHSVDDAFED